MPLPEIIRMGLAQEMGIEINKPKVKINEDAQPVIQQTGVGYYDVNKPDAYAEFMRAAEERRKWVG